jgi:hypothetical protein
MLFTAMKNVQNETKVRLKAVSLETHDKAHMGGNINVYRFLVGKSEGRRQLGRPRRRSEENIKRFLDRMKVRGLYSWL